MCILFFWTAPDANGAIAPPLSGPGSPTVAAAIAATYTVILASNRDEVLSRPTLRAHRWETSSGSQLYRDTTTAASSTHTESPRGDINNVPPAPPTVFGARDASFGGTWLGVAGTEEVPCERWAVVTNVREKPSSNRKKLNGRPSRGELVTRFLNEGAYPRDTATADRYDAFNGIFGDVGASRVSYSTNRRANECGAPVAAGECHCVSNAALDSPWPKAVRGLDAFRRVLAVAPSAAAPLTEADDRALARLLLDEVLRDRAQCAPATDTGCDAELEKKLAHVMVPVFDIVPGEPYGTRTQTVVLVRRDGDVLYVERNCTCVPAPNGEEASNGRPTSSSSSSSEDLAARINADDADCWSEVEHRLRRSEESE